jgi:hypothetical protein
MAPFDTKPPTTPGSVEGIAEARIYGILIYMALARIGLYYPYVHFRHKDWLKVAALYWPKIARIVPDVYPVHDDPITQSLIDELDFVINISPDSGRADASRMMLEALVAHDGGLGHSRYQVPPDWLVSGQKDDYRLATDNWADGIDEGVRRHKISVENTPKWRQERPLAALSSARMSKSLAHLLIHERIAVRADPWLGVHPRVAWVYMCVLAEQLGRLNNLSPVTDQVLAHAQSNGWTRERIIGALLEPSFSYATEQVPETAIGLLAVQLVVPRGLAQVPVQKVIRLRQRYAADFDAFHDVVTIAATDLRDAITGITDRAVLEAYVAQEVQRRFDRPLADLRKAFKGLGIDTTFAVANMKFELPTALVTSGGVVAHQPVLAGAGAVAFGVLTLGRGVRLKWAERAKPSAASYLWRIEGGVTPESLIRRLLHRQ